ncbi:MAG: hypothetical protein ACI4SQ_00550 [Eubacterium sp.]
MTLFEFIKDRKRKAILFFLTGFFSGGILYFFCKEAAADTYANLWENIKIWMAEEMPFVSTFLYTLWRRGKVAFVIFLAGNTRWNRSVFRTFILWEGAKAGFFMTLFCMKMAIKGFFSAIAMGIPHMFLFVPAYVFFFYGSIEKKRKYKNGISVGFIVAIVLGCVVQAAVGQKVVYVLQTFTFW